MSESNIESHVSCLYRETQTIVLEQALGIIADVGNAEAKAVALEALNIAQALQATADFSDGLKSGAELAKGMPLTTKAAKKAQPKAKAKAKKRTSSKAKNKAPKKRTIKLITPIESGTSMSLNGDDISSNGYDAAGRLLAFRSRESLSQKKAAARAEVSISSWQAWESGKWVPGEEMMRRLEKVGV